MNGRTDSKNPFSTLSNGSRTLVGFHSTHKQYQLHLVVGTIRCYPMNSHQLCQLRHLVSVATLLDPLNVIWCEVSVLCCQHTNSSSRPYPSEFQWLQAEQKEPLSRKISKRIHFRQLQDPGSSQMLRQRWWRLGFRNAKPNFHYRSGRIGFGRTKVRG